MADTKGVVVGLPIALNLLPTASNSALSASTTRVAWVFQAYEDATITHLGFRYGVRTGTPPVYRISLQGMDGSGNPDGTVLGGGTPASQTFTPPASAAWDGTWQWVALANSIAVTRGAWYGIVIDYSSGTIDASNNSSFTRTYNASCNSPYGLDYTGSWAKSNAYPVFGYKSSTRVYGNPVKSVSSVAFGATATPDEAGIKFTLNAGFGSTFQVLGLFGLMRFQVAALTGNLKLYNSVDTVLQDTAIDTDNAAATPILVGQSLFDESSLPALNFGDTYRVTFVATAGTSTGISVMYLETESAAEMEAFSLGVDMILTQRTDGGAWTDTNTRKPLFAPIIVDWTEPAGSSGGYIF